MNFDIEKLLAAEGLSVSMVEAFERVLKHIDSARAADRRNTIVFAAYNEDGTAVTRGETSSTKADRDLSAMFVALEFLRAVSRGVPITPNELWTHVMRTKPPREPGQDEVQHKAEMFDWIASKTGSIRVYSSETSSSVWNLSINYESLFAWHRGDSLADVVTAAMKEDKS